MTDFLEQVIAERRADVAAAKARVQEYDLLEHAYALDRSETSMFRRRTAATLAGPTQGERLHREAGDLFTAALLRTRREGRLAVIAEVKRRSPALGVLGEEVDVPALARRYATAGAAAISVLTEPRHWDGSLEDIVAIRGHVDVPILCKDIIVDEYQLVEARAAGADAALLIAEALEGRLLHQMVERAMILGLGLLVEAHEPAAFGRAVACGARVVGVNARNLRKPSEIDVGRVRQLHTFVHADQILVAESGITSVDDARMLPARVDAVLIGTALMRADEPGPLIQSIASIKRTVSV
jgi:indole-3-glycerol phosphate synthase